MFFLFCSVNAILIISASFVITTRNPLHSVLCLVCCFLSASISLFLLENEFLALFFLIIYLGAIAILFLFVVMMLDIKYKDFQTSKLYFPAGCLIGVTAFFEISKAFSSFSSKDSNQSGEVFNHYINWYDLLDSLSDINTLGQIFYTHYVLQILIAGLILYIAVIGVSFLTVKAALNRNNSKAQFISKQLSRRNVL